MAEVSKSDSGSPYTPCTNESDRYKAFCKTKNSSRPKKALGAGGGNSPGAPAASIID